MAGGMAAATVPTTGGGWLGLLGVGVTLLVVSLAADWARAFFSGWMSLAKAYRENTPPRRGPLFSSYRYALMNWWQPLHRNRATLTERGVYLRTAYQAFRPFHPPLLLPWPGFKEREVYRTGRTQQVILHFEDSEGRRMSVPLPRAAVPLIRKLSGRSDFSGEALK